MANSKVGEVLHKINTTIEGWQDKANNYAQSIWNTMTGDDFKTSGVKDKTNENLGTNIVGNEKPLWQQQQELLWQREDEKQKHIEQREDTSVSRYVEDLRRSGVNPNIYNGGQAASGGGLTNATQADYSMDIAEYNKKYEMIMQEIELKFKGTQAEKDRFAELVNSLIKGGAIIGNALLK